MQGCGGVGTLSFRDEGGGDAGRAKGHRSDATGRDQAETRCPSTVRRGREAKDGTNRVARGSPKGITDCHEVGAGGQPASRQRDRCGYNTKAPRDPQTQTNRRRSVGTFLRLRPAAPVVGASGRPSTTRTRPTSCYPRG